MEISRDESQNTPAAMGRNLEGMETMFSIADRCPMLDRVVELENLIEQIEATAKTVYDARRFIGTWRRRQARKRKGIVAA